MNEFKNEIEYQDSIELFANIFGHIRINHEEINAQCREISVSFLINSKPFTNNCYLLNFMLKINI